MRIFVVLTGRELPPEAQVLWYLRRYPCRYARDGQCACCHQYGGHGPYWIAWWRLPHEPRRQYRFMGHMRPSTITDAEVEDTLRRFRRNQ
ncbi:MAG: hypothetical protein H0X24_09930 [Ktedonobacterales bacterium]|nr:hypothetical protein [Ktedonobacterales bacterium]